MVSRTTDEGGFINSSIVTGQKNNLPFRYKDILNTNFPVVVGTKVHFEVDRRGGRCIAVRINVIGNPGPLVGYKKKELSPYSYPE